MMFTVLSTELMKDGLIVSRLHICRLEKLWKEEVRRVGVKKASMSRVVFQFIRTRFFVASIPLLIFVGLIFFIIVSLSLYCFFSAPLLCRDNNSLYVALSSPAKSGVHYTTCA